MAALWLHLLLFIVRTSGVWSLPVNVDSSTSGPFSGYQVLEIGINKTDNVTDFLMDLQSRFQVDVWGRPSKNLIDVMISPEQRDDVILFLRERAEGYKVKIPDVQKLVESQVKTQSHQVSKRSTLPLSAVTYHYLTYPQILLFLRGVQENATQADVSISSLGDTFEGRMTPFVSIRQRNPSHVNKSVVILEAGIHAREWIAPAMALNIIYKLAFNPDGDPDVDQLLRMFDWIIIPVTNPDGYVYSHLNESTRLWRKTRTTQYSNDGRCVGVDGNRNFGFQWSNSVYKGGNSNPCTENFSGPQGFSEPETQNLRSLLLRLRSRAALYLSMHSYGQFFLYPWGYDPRASLEDEPDLREIGQRFSESMLQRNRWYEVGASAKILYTAAGASDDYARGGAGIKYAFTVELSPSDSSPYGFLLPSQRIPSVVNDHWPAFKAVAQAVWMRLNQTNSANNNSNNNNNDSSSAFSGSYNDSDEENEDNQLLDLFEDSDSADDLPLRVGRRNPTPKSSMDDDNEDATEIMIGGQIFHINFNNPTFTRWMENYIEFMNFRRLQGKRWRR